MPTLSRKKYDNSTFFSRIDILRKITGDNQEEFAIKTNISRSFYSDMKNGGSGLSFRFVEGIFRYIDNLNPKWLFFGEGEMFLEVGSQSKVLDRGGDYGSSPKNELETLFNEALTRSEAEQEAIANMLKGILQLTKK